MKRRLLNLLTALSLMLCVAVVALWVRSHFVVDEVVYFGHVRARGCDGVSFVSYAGTLMCYWDHYSFPPADRLAFIGRASSGRVASEFRRGVSRYRDAEEYRQNRDNFGLGWFDSAVERQRGMWKTSGISCVRRTVRVPHGTVAVALLICPVAVGFHRSYTRRRRRSGLCPACGYDLRATPGRCPECGLIPAGAAA